MPRMRTRFLMKIYFAGAECINHLAVCFEAGVKHHLYTAWKYLAPVFDIKTHTGFLSAKNRTAPQYINESKNPAILDSGLFSLMFGKHGKTVNEKLISEYQEKYIQLIIDNKITHPVVECDCQNLVGQKVAWKLREELREAVPNTIINCIHLSDGVKGADRLIEYAEYISIGCPEQKRADHKNHVRNIIRLAKYIHKKRPELKIHLLGTTNEKILKEVPFITSADSTSWQSGIRYATYKNHSLHNIKKDYLQQYEDRARKIITQYGFPKSENNLRYNEWELLVCEVELANYTKLYGSQEK